MDVMKVAANLSKQLMENDRVRVLEGTLKPGDFAKMHHHPDHVMYVINGGKLKISSEGKAREMELTEGQAAFFKAEDHFLIKF